MERFAFKIDRALRANLHKICRLCGIDNPEMLPILCEPAAVMNVDEPDLYQKILDCIGLIITKDDKMPQTMCTICADKINDFYEFREMCYATDAQTRKLLGLKNEVSRKVVCEDVKPLVCAEIKDEASSTVALAKRGRKRKSDEQAGKFEMKSGFAEIKIEDTVNCMTSRKKSRLGEALTAAQKKYQKKLKTQEDIKEEPSELSITASAVAIAKLKQSCNICEQRFTNKAALERHQTEKHVPNIPRYICTACDETIKKGMDIKNHQLWHKLSKTPYLCPLCRISVPNIYAFTRHLREHSFSMPTAALVLDRECPQCHETFVTNYLYNTHICALRTKKCAGCNRILRNDADYLRHAALCLKVYRNYSKHITDAAVVAEAGVRIKNENDVEAAAAEALARNAGISMDMAPVVSLTRLSSPILSIASNAKKSNKKGVLRKDLKRVDELLKSTIDALVSIKHEPEVHVDTDAAQHAEHAPDHVEQDAGAIAFDDCHHDQIDDYYDDGVDNDGSVDAENSTVGQHRNVIALKQEVMDESCQLHPSDVVAVNIKQELFDADNSCDELTGGNKMPLLKIKIKKEHGTLNSSLVDDGGKSEKRKKKKKRKEAEKNREKWVDKNQNTNEHNSSNDGPMAIKIKQERLDDSTDPDVQQKPEATVMTSIPMMQFQIACVSSGVEFSASEIQEQAQEQNETETNETPLTVELPDVKPNKAELDHLLQQTANVNTHSTIIEAVPVRQYQLQQQHKSPTNHRPRESHEPTCSRPSIKTGTGKAVKSTSGVPKIVAIISGIEVPYFNEGHYHQQQQQLETVYIKPEPCNRGYSDELPAGEKQKEASYINSIDFSNIKIKQERDIEVSNVQVQQSEIHVAHLLQNGRMSGATKKAEIQAGVAAAQEKMYHTYVNDGEFDSEAHGDEDDEEVEEEMEVEHEIELEEDREYRELEMPPPLMSDDNPTTVVTANDAPTFIITNVCSQAKEPRKALEDVSLNDKQFEIATVAVGCTDFANNVINNANVNLKTTHETEQTNNEEKEVEQALTDATVATIVGETSGDSETLLMAKPFFDKKSSVDGSTVNDDSSASSNDADAADIEQQNLLNHEVAAELTATGGNAVSMQILLPPYLENISSTSGSAFDDITATTSNSRTTMEVASTSSMAAKKIHNNEETENLINESADEAQQQQQLLLSDIRIDDNRLSFQHILHDDSNINEIAENNNNANIERELQVDSALDRHFNTNID